MFRPSNTREQSPRQALIPRILSFFAGAGLLAASVWALVEASSPSQSGAALLIALAGGIAAAAIAIPRCGRTTAAALMCAMLCAEGYSLLASGDRIVTARSKVADAVKNVNQQAAQAAAQLDAARVALANHRAEVRSKVAEPGCKVVCREKLDELERALIRERDDAKRALDAAPQTRSATPFADVLRVQPWQLDLAMAALLSVGANGLAALLIGFAARPGQNRTIEVVRENADKQAAKQPENEQSKLFANNHTENNQTPVNTDVSLFFERSEKTTQAAEQPAEQAAEQADKKTTDCAIRRPRGRPPGGRSDRTPRTIRATDDAVARLVREAGGRLKTSVGDVAKRLDVTRSTANAAINMSVQRGAVKKTTASRYTLLEIA